MESAGRGREASRDDAVVLRGTMNRPAIARDTFEPRMGTPLGVIAAGSSLFNVFFVIIASPLVGWAVVAAKALSP